MTRKRVLLVALVIVCVAGGVAAAHQRVLGGMAGAQQNVPPPPKPPDDGPSLADTMKFMQNKLDGLKVNYMIYYHNNVTGEDWSHKFSDEFTKVVADPGACQVRDHFNETNDGNTKIDQDRWFNLKAVKTIRALSGEQLFRELFAASGKPEVSGKFDPPVFILRAEIDHDHNFNFYLYDGDLADRLAKAMVHAVELCGGGNKDPF